MIFKADNLLDLANWFIQCKSDELVKAMNSKTQKETRFHEGRADVYRELADLIKSKSLILLSEKDNGNKYEESKPNQVQSPQTGVRELVETNRGPGSSEVEVRVSTIDSEGRADREG